MTSQSQPIDVNALFQSAVADGSISPGTAKVITAANLGSTIEANLGIKVENVKASEVVLVNLLVDDSGSVEAAGNSQAIREGMNGVLDAIMGAKKRDDVLVYVEFLNKGLVQPYVLLPQAARYDATNYRPRGETPLYKKAVEFLGTVLAKSQEFALAGVPCRTISLIATDGGDNASGRTKAADVKAIVSDMLKAETHLIFGFGISDGYTDFEEVFRKMGAKKEFVLISASDGKEIREKLQLFSQSAVRASQNAASFSKVAGAGFTA